ncbi:hypothetical protein LQW54_002078 [Pestalotiopsis sp. IQ-011]
MALLLLDQPLHTAAFGAAVLFALVLAKWVFATLRPRDFPPGPPIIPGLGNLHQMTIAKPYLRFHEWSKQYGEVVGLKIGTGNLVLLNTPDLVHELFDKRGAICSNRPVNHILTNYVHSAPEEKGIAILQYDDYYRCWRKSFQFILGAAGIKPLRPLLEAEALSLCQKFIDGSKDYEQCCRHWAVAVPLVAMTGGRLDDKPSNYADNYIPEVVASWKSRARAVRKYMVDDASEYLIGAKKTCKQITENPASANGNTKEPFTDTELAYIGQVAVGAAVDTTLATFKSLMIAFAAFPEKLAKAQEESDRVASDGPLSGSRIGELRYLRTCISEVLRWRPTAPRALLHVITKDERVGEYAFPAGTMFIANAWTIHRNEEEYDLPDEFIPERFMDNEFGPRPGYKAGSGRRALYAFGSGRRQCPGEDFAVTAVLLTASKII